MYKRGKGPVVSERPFTVLIPVAPHILFIRKTRVIYLPLNALHRALILKAECWLESLTFQLLGHERTLTGALHSNID